MDKEVGSGLSKNTPEMDFQALEFMASVFGIWNCH